MPQPTKAHISKSGRGLVCADQHVGRKPQAFRRMLPLNLAPQPELWPHCPLLLAWDLGVGETQVIALALKSNRKRVVLDDLEARRCARAMGLPVIGTLGIVARAKRLGIIGPLIRLHVTGRGAFR